MLCACRARTLIEDSDMLHLSLTYMHTRPRHWTPCISQPSRANEELRLYRIPPCTREPNDSDGFLVIEIDAVILSRARITK